MGRVSHRKQFRNLSFIQCIFMIQTYHFFETLLFLILEMTFPFSSPVASGRPGSPAGASGARTAAGPRGHCRAQNLSRMR